jgi:serine/threonine protein kinase
MSSLRLPTGGVQHCEAALEEEYELTSASLLSSGHGVELLLSRPLDGGARVRIALTRTDGAEWRLRAERQISLMEEMATACCGHLLPLLRVVRPPRGHQVGMVMPHLPGGDLFDRLERHGSLPEGVARSVAMQLLSAVEQLHSHHIMHGDLQPAALLFESDEPRNATLRVGEQCRYNAVTMPLQCRYALRVGEQCRHNPVAMPLQCRDNAVTMP